MNRVSLLPLVSLTVCLGLAAAPPALGDCPGKPLVVQKDLANPGEALFGTSVAANPEGTLIAVGAPGIVASAAPPNPTGVVRLFARSGNDGWAEQDLTPTPQGTRFGWSVALSNDWLAVGAPLDSERGTAAGAVYMYQAKNIAAKPIKLMAADTTSFDAFGFALAINDTGNTLVVGAPLHDTDDSRGNSGAVYVFKLLNLNWVQVAKLNPADAERDDQLGTSVAISPSGELIAAGAPQPERDDSRNGKAGKAYIFQRDASENWSSSRRVALTGRNSFDAFGFSVAFIHDEMVAIGAPGFGEQSGLLYVFVRQNESWRAAATTPEVAACVPSERAEFGFALAARGGLLVVGARREADHAGALYVFRPIGVGLNLTAKIPNPSASPSLDEFGWSVAMGDKFLVAGAPLSESEGKVFAFEFTGLEVRSPNSRPSAVPGKRETLEIASANNLGDNPINAKVELEFDHQMITNAEIGCIPSNATCGCSAQPCPARESPFKENVTLKSNGNIAYTLTGSVNPSARKPLKGSFKIETLGDADVDTSNNETGTEIALFPQSDLAIKMGVNIETPKGAAESEKADPAVAGQDSLVYTLTVTNQGPSDVLKDVTVIDTLPQGLRLPEKKRNIEWTIPKLLAAEGQNSKQFKFEAEVLPDTRDSVVNSAIVRGNGEGDAPPDRDNKTKKETLVKADVNLRVKVEQLSANPINAGETVNYKITLINDGPSDALNLSVEIPPITKFTIESGNPDLGNFYLPNLWNVGTLSARDSNRKEAHLLVVGRIDPDLRSNFAFTAIATKEDHSTVSSQAPATEVIGKAVLSLKETLSPKQAVIAGDKVEYSFRIHNDGPSHAKDVEAKVKLGTSPPMAISIPSEIKAGTDEVTGIVTFDVPADSRTPLNATLTLTWTEIPKGISYPVSIDVKAEIDLVVTAETTPRPATAGDSLTFTLNACNKGPSDAKDISVTFPIPEGVTIDTAWQQPDGVTVDSEKLVWEIDALPGKSCGASQMLAVPALISNRCDILESNIKVELNGGTPGPSDPPVRELNATDNEYSLIVPVMAESDLAITLEGPSPVTPANPADPIVVTYTIKIDNHGPNDAGPVLIEDVFPASLSKIHWTCEGKKDALGNDIYCDETRGDGSIRQLTKNLPAKESLTFVVTAILDSSLPGPLYNVSTVAATSARDPNLANNADSKIEVLSSGNSPLAIAMVAPEHQVECGEITYRIALSRASGITAEFDDELDINDLTLLSAGILSGGGTLTLDMGTNKVRWQDTTGGPGTVEIVISALIKGVANSSTGAVRTISNLGTISSSTMQVIAKREVEVRGSHCPSSATP